MENKNNEKIDDILNVVTFDSTAGYLKIKSRLFKILYKAQMTVEVHKRAAEISITPEVDLDRQKISIVTLALKATLNNYTIIISRMIHSYRKMIQISLPLFLIIQFAFLTIKKNIDKPWFVKLQKRLGFNLLYLWNLPFIWWNFLQYNFDAVRRGIITTVKHFTLPEINIKEAEYTRYIDYAAKINFKLGKQLRKPYFKPMLWGQLLQKYKPRSFLFKTNTDIATYFPSRFTLLQINRHGYSFNYSFKSANSATVYSKKPRWIHLPEISFT